MFFNKKQLDAIRDCECVRVNIDGEDLVVMSADVYARITELEVDNASGPQTRSPQQGSLGRDLTYPLTVGAALFMMCFVCVCIGASLGHREKSDEQEPVTIVHRAAVPMNVDKPAGPSKDLPKNDANKPVTPVKQQDDVEEFIQARNKAIPKPEDVTDINWLLWLFPGVVVLFAVAAVIFWLMK